jgi:hypothetical protein
MIKHTEYPNEIYMEETPRSSLSYDEQNDLTLTPNNNHSSDLEKISTIKTEKYDVEAGVLETVEPVRTSKYSIIYS